MQSTSSKTAQGKREETLSTTSIRVVVRIRPPLSSPTDALAIEAYNENMAKITSTGNAYKFHHVFNASASQALVYEKTAADLVQDLVRGSNVTIFAYGQTASGKTHTMFGHKNDGIAAQAVKDTFDSIKKLLRTPKVEMSYMEVYNDNIFDRLSEESLMEQSKQKPLKLRYISGKSAAVLDLTWLHVKSPSDVVNKMMHASNRCVKKDNGVHEYSSRGHRICSLRIDDDDKLHVKLVFVDLAGQEKPDLEKGQVLFKESNSINIDLLHLKKAFSQISEGKAPTLGNRELTKVLYSSFIGNAKTVMVACISAEALMLERSKTTLDFASMTESVQVQKTTLEKKGTRPQQDSTQVHCGMVSDTTTLALPVDESSQPQMTKDSVSRPATSSIFIDASNAVSATKATAVNSSSQPQQDNTRPSDDGRFGESGRNQENVNSAVNGSITFNTYNIVNNNVVVEKNPKKRKPLGDRTNVSAAGAESVIDKYRAFLDDLKTIDINNGVTADLPSRNLEFEERLDLFLGYMNVYHRNLIKWRDDFNIFKFEKGGENGISYEQLPIFKYALTSRNAFRQNVSRERANVVKEGTLKYLAPYAKSDDGYRINDRGRYFKLVEQFI